MIRLVIKIIRTVPAVMLVRRVSVVIMISVRAVVTALRVGTSSVSADRNGQEDSGDDHRKGF